MHLVMPEILFKSLDEVFLEASDQTPILYGFTINWMAAAIERIYLKNSCLSLAAWRYCVQELMG